MTERDRQNQANTMRNPKQNHKIHAIFRGLSEGQIIDDSWVLPGLSLCIVEKKGTNGLSFSPCSKKRLL